MAMLKQAGLPEQEQNFERREERGQMARLRVSRGTGQTDDSLPPGKTPSPPTPHLSDSDQGLVKLVTSLHALSQSEDESDLTQAKSIYQRILEASTPENDLYAYAFDGCLETLQRIHQRSGSIDPLDEALGLYEVALRQQPAGHPLRIRTLKGYASLHTNVVKLATSNEHRGRLINHYRNLLQKLSAEEHGYDSCLNYLAIALYEHFKLNGGLDVLEEAIGLNRKALKIRDTKHPFRETSLNGLAIVLQLRFRVTRNFDDLEEAISSHMETLDLRPPGHPLRDVTLHNLGSIFGTKFEQDGLRDTLDKAVYYTLATLELRPPGHPFRFLALSGAGAQYQRLFDCCGREEHLAQAIDFLREAIEQPTRNTRARSNPQQPCPQPKKHTMSSMATQEIWPSLSIFIVKLSHFDHWVILNVLVAYTTSLLLYQLTMTNATSRMISSNPSG